MDNLINQKYGRLLVLEKCEKINYTQKYKCLCDCGKVKSISKYNILNGRTKSCGCIQKEAIYNNLKINITGQKFGRLTVVKEHGRSNSKKKQITWLCKCECGKECVISGSLLRDSETKSCGCLYVNNPGKTGINVVKLRYKKSAKKRNLNFLLNENEFLILITSNCHYCNKVPSQLAKLSGKNHTLKTQERSKFFYNGIDRIDSKEDYILNNCVTCCKWCNQAKSTMAYEEFRIHIKNINNHWATK